MAKSKDDLLEEYRLELDKYKFELDKSKLEVEKQKVKHDEWKAIMQTAVDFAGQYIKATLILNGAAALAFLTLIGHMYSSNNPDFAKVPKTLVPSLVYFGWGAVVAIFAAFLGYVTQYLYSRAVINPKKPCIECTAIFFHVAAILISLSSLVLFVLGMYSAVDAFSSISSSAVVIP